MVSSGRQGIDVSKANLGLANLSRNPNLAQSDVDVSEHVKSVVKIKTSRAAFIGGFILQSLNLVKTCTSTCTSN
jgi:hypothetical protein